MQEADEAQLACSMALGTCKASTGKFWKWLATADCPGQDMKSVQKGIPASKRVASGRASGVKHCQINYADEK